MVPGLQYKRLTSFDGTQIAYQVRGRGPAIVLANGLGGTYEAFRHLYTALGDRYRIVCWDYRGLYNSAVPRDLETLAIPFHCDDLDRVLDAEQVAEAVFIGWSMGVQVNFEYWRRRRHRFRGIVAMNGTSGRPFRTVFSSRFVRHVIPGVLRAVRDQAAFVGEATRRVVAWRGMVAAIQRLGIVSKDLDVAAFRDVAEAFMDVDWRVYSDLLRQLGQHDASDVLDSIDVPTLVIAGDRDVLTPACTAENICRRVSNARLVVVPGGTHYVPLEYPRVITRALGQFLAHIPGYRHSGDNPEC